MVSCAFPACNRPLHCKGLCNAHYRQRHRGQQLQPVRPVGFGGLTPTQRRDMASRGGRAAHQKGTAHRWTQEEAARVGLIAAARRHSWGPVRLATELHRRGLT